MDCSLPGSSVHEILQARILKPEAIPFSRRSSWPKDKNQVSCITDRLFYHLSHQGSSLQSVLILEKECCIILINLERKRLTALTFIEHLCHVDIMPHTSLYFFLINFNWRLITILWWFLPCIDMNQPQVYTCPPSGTPLPPPSPSRPSGSSQCNSFECPVSCIELGLVICFTYGNIHVSMLFAQIIPLSPSPTESKSLFMVPHCDFGLHFSDNEWCWASFHVFVNHLYVFFGETSV